MKKIDSLQPFFNTLPYSSELFGVYQPLIGWKSKRKEKKWKTPDKLHHRPFVEGLINYFDGITKMDFNEDCAATLSLAEPGEYAGPKEQIGQMMREGLVPSRRFHEPISSIIRMVLS